MRAITIGVSACLLGQHVRYDGGHKQDHYITDTLGRFFNFLPVCPEVESGLPTPREAMRLEGDSESPRLMTRISRIDKSEQMRSYCELRVKALESDDLCGFIFKKDSPSSGLYRVKVYNNNVAVKTGRGLFADAVVRHFHLMPVEEEGRLNDAEIRENFIERVFSYRRWKDFLLERSDIAGLVEFHTAHKLLIMSHSTQYYREMGALVGNPYQLPKKDLFAAYEALLMKALALQATVKKNTNVLMHIMGYFKKQLDPGEKQELLALINQYHDRLVPLIVPLTLLKHYVNKYDQAYLKQQLYLSPHPAELMLRNHV